MKKIKNKLSKSLSAILAFAILISGIIIPNKIVLAAPSGIKVTNHGGGEGRGSDYFTSSDGYYIFCGEASLNPPVNPGNTSTLTGWREEKNEKVRKVAYYGYASPEKWSKLETFNLYGVPANKGSKGYHLTHYALSNVWGTSSKYFERNSEMQEFMSFINKKPNAPDWFKVYSTKSGGTQRMFAWNFNKPTPPQKKHSLSLVKTSANKTLTDIAKAGYSLKGAEYGVYATKVNALNNKNLLNKLITDDKGKSNKLDLVQGKYFVKEIKAPKGFKLDKHIYEVDLTSKDQVLNVKDEPLFDPLTIMVRKENESGKPLEGAEFTVKYYNEILTSTKGKTPVRTWKFRTDNNGQFGFRDEYKIGGDELFKSPSGIPMGLIGTYEFIETKAPKGYILDPKPVLAWVKENGATNPGTVYNMPIVTNESAEKELKLVKVDSETGKQIPQSEVTFNILDKDMNVLTIGGDKEFKTDSKGVVTLKEKVLPGIYHIKEIKAPSGYYLDPNGKAIKIEIFENDTKVIIKEIKNTPQKGIIRLEKTGSILSGTKANQKDKDITDLIFEEGFLAGTKWEIRAKEEIKSLDGVTILYTKGQVVDTIVTTATGVVNSKQLPIGKYTFKEIEAPKGYLIDPRVYEIEITPQTQEIRVSSQSVKAYNERKELTFEFSKTFEDTKLFTIEPKATFGLFLNEDYKENGITVKKDTLLDKVTIDVNNITEKVTEKEVNGTKEVKEDVISYEVSTFTEKEVENKDKPIIKSNEYTIYEVKLQNGEVKVFNTKEEALSFIETQKDKANLSVKESKKSEDVIVGYETKVERTLDKVFKFNTLEEKDKKIAELEENKTLYEVKEFKTTVTKQVEDTENKVIEKLVERKAKGKFKDILIDGKFYIKEISTAKGYVLDNTKHETGFDFNTTDKKQNTVIGANITNKLNKITLDVTKIEAGSVEEGNKKVVSGAEYVLIATDSEKGETTVGKYITDENGKIVVENLPNGKYIFKELNAPEGYFKNEEEINLNFTDEKDGSTYKVEVINEKIPEIRTTATDNETGKKTVNPINIIQIKDIVKYKDLIIDKEYVMKGVLMDKETNKPILDNKGKEVRAEKTFIPQTRNGEVELIFTLNADILRGKTTVVFEDLYKDGKLLVSHNDINDKDQTIKITNPKIGTTFSEIKTNEKVLDPMGVVTLIDNVDYNNLIKGEEYTAKLKVMDQETNKPLLIDGKEVVAETTFIAKSENGTIKVSVDIDLTKVRGKEIVAFEKLIYKGEVIASHEDIEDKDQTIKVTDPSLKTSAKFKDGNKVNEKSSNMAIIDTVNYYNLIVGKKYTIDGILMDKKTNKPLLINGKEVTASTTFVAESKDGSIEIVFNFDGSKLKDTKIVVFESLSREGVELASHADIKDMEQTVLVKTPKPENPNTGDRGIFMIVTTFIVSLISLYFVTKKQRQINR
ncbi:VaFE repeat-containing surface-anchored protein [Helcococcus bovis]|uniref:VaFE repeat-containing surface-anchored protein n=1 Tax=Helcococcus bovis TaxID=3153252 RepID=UPI0038B7828E